MKFKIAFTSYFHMLLIALLLCAVSPVISYAGETEVMEEVEEGEEGEEEFERKVETEEVETGDEWILITAVIVISITCYILGGKLLFSKKE